MTTFYVATGLENIERAKALIAELKLRGLQPSYDWTIHGSLQDRPEQWPFVAEKEWRGVKDACFIVVLLPGGRGTHVELGAAMSAGTDIYLVATPDQLEQDGRTCIFYHHPYVNRVDSVESLFTKLLNDGRYE